MFSSHINSQQKLDSVYSLKHHFTCAMAVSTMALFENRPVMTITKSETEWHPLAWVPQCYVPGMHSVTRVTKKKRYECLGLKKVLTAQAPHNALLKYLLANDHFLRITLLKLHLKSTSSELIIKIRF